MVRDVGLLVVGILLVLLMSPTCPQQPATDNIRLTSSQFTSAENEVRGQLEAKVINGNEWRKTCVSNATVRENGQLRQSLLNIVCRDLGFDRGVDITFGVQGVPGIQGRAIDIQSCPVGATSFAQCARISVQNQCGRLYYISVQCADQSPVDAPVMMDPDKGPMMDQYCQRSVSYRIAGPLASIRLNFSRAIIPSGRDCRITLVLAQPTNPNAGTAFYLTSPTELRLNARPIPVNSPCTAFSHVVVTQSLAPSPSSGLILQGGLPAVALKESRLCRQNEPITIDPMANSVSFILSVKPASAGALDLHVTLHVRPVIELRCGPAGMELSVVKPRLSSVQQGHWEVVVGKERYTNTNNRSCLLQDTEGSGAVGRFRGDMRAGWCDTNQVTGAPDHYLLTNTLLIMHSLPVQLGPSGSANANTPIERSESFQVAIICRMGLSHHNATLINLQAQLDPLPPHATFIEPIRPPSPP